MTRVVHLSSVHKADDVRIFYKECRSLARAGYDVVLIARADEDYERDGVQIRAVRGGAGNRLARMTRTVWQVFRMALAEDGDIYHFHDPELIPVGIVLKLRGKRVIYDAHEDFHAQLQAKSWLPVRMRKPIAQVVGRAEQIAVRALDRIVVANPIQSYRFPRTKTIAVQNFPMMSELEGLSTTGYQDREPIVVYIGGLEEIRGIREMIEAIEIVNRTTRATLILGGNFQSQLFYNDVAKYPGWEFVRYSGFLSREQVIATLRRSRIGLVVVHPAPNYLTNQPVKMFEYMIAGLPVIASDFPNYRPFVGDLRTGVMVDPRDPTAIAKAIIRLLANPQESEAMGARGREVVLDRFNWDAQAAILVKMYCDILPET